MEKLELNKYPESQITMYPINKTSNNKFGYLSNFTNQQFITQKFGTPILNKYKLYGYCDYYLETQTTNDTNKKYYHKEQIDCFINNSYLYVVEIIQDIDFTKFPNINQYDIEKEVTEFIWSYKDISIYVDRIVFNSDSQNITKVLEILALEN
jgi:hypothetical protein